MTKKKQSKRATKAAAKKGKRSGVDPTLHEIPVAQAPLSTDAHELSATEPINSERDAPDIAAQPSSPESIVDVVEADESADKTSDAQPEQVAVAADNGHQTLDVAPEIPVVEHEPGSDRIVDASKPESLVESETRAKETAAEESQAHSLYAEWKSVSDQKSETTAPAEASAAKVETKQEPVPEPKIEAVQAEPEPQIEESKPEPSSAETKTDSVTKENLPESSPSIGVGADDIPAPLSPQITSYDIAALENPTIPQSTPDIAATLKSMPNPFGNLESLGKLQRSKSSAEVSKSLQSQTESTQTAASHAPAHPAVAPQSSAPEPPAPQAPAPQIPAPAADTDWKAPVDYFGASAAAFSTSFSGSKSRDLNALKAPLDASSNAPDATPPTPFVSQQAQQPSPPQIEQSFSQVQQPQPQTQPAQPAFQPVAPQVQPNVAHAQPVPTAMPQIQLPPQSPPGPQVSAPQPVTQKADPLAALDSALTRTYNSAPAVSSSNPASPPASGTPSQTASPAASAPVAPAPNGDVGVSSSTGLSPKMAMFVNSLREKGLAPAEDAQPAPNPVQMKSTSVEMSPLPSPKQFESTSVDVAPLPSAKQFESTAVDMPKVSTDAQMQSTSVDVAPLNVPNPTILPIARPDKQQPKVSGATARDLTAMPKNLEADDGFKPVELDMPDFAQKADMAELRESIKQDDWRPITKKTARTADPSFAKSLEREGIKPQEPKPKPQPGDMQRHLTLEEMAALEDPDLALQQATPQQQTIRQLKGKTTAGVRFELYLLVYIVCLGLSWLTEQSAMSGTCRDAGQRIQSAIQAITPKPLADNFIAGVNAFDDKDIKQHPFNPKNPPSAMQVVLRKCGAFSAGIGSAFGRIPTILAAASANALAETLILLAYASVFIISVLIYFKFRRTLQYGIADVMLLPICLLAAFSGISAVLTAVLSMSESLAVSYIPNTIVVFTTLTIILSALDMARRSFLRRKQNISGRD